MAGCRDGGLFAPAAVKRLYRASGGVPRLINILAHKALLAAFGEGARHITARHVKDAIADTESLAPYGSWVNRLLRYVTALAAMVAVSVGALLWGLWA